MSEGVDDQFDGSIGTETTESKSSKAVDDVPGHDGLVDRGTTSETTDPSLHTAVVTDDSVGGRVEAFTG